MFHNHYSDNSAYIALNSYMETLYNPAFPVPEISPAWKLTFPTQKMNSND